MSAGVDDTTASATTCLFPTSRPFQPRHDTALTKLGDADLSKHNHATARCPLRDYWILSSVRVFCLSHPVCRAVGRAVPSRYLRQTICLCWWSPMGSFGVMIRSVAAHCPGPAHGSDLSVCPSGASPRVYHTRCARPLPSPARLNGPVDVPGSRLPGVTDRPACPLQRERPRGGERACRTAPL